MNDFDFKKQIYEDIEYYRYLYPNVKNISKDEWAFNFWVLDKMYRIDEEIIESQITDYNDKGIDCFAFFEETKELYIIQNKFYGNTCLNHSYVENEFLERPIFSLEQGTYKRSKELQTIFNKNKKDKDFMVYLQLYVANNNVSDHIYEKINNFNKKNNGKYKAEILKLDDIQTKYFGELFKVKKSMDFQINTVNSGTVLQVNTKSYEIDNPLDAKYIFTPVYTIYEFIRKSKQMNYSLFEENIREYLGNKGINKNIYKTLLDPEERKNFFYYNNGITIICEEMSSIKTGQVYKNIKASINIINPQIVNGCQTANSIYEALNNYSDENVLDEFKDTFVMLKVLKINPNDINNEHLYKNIVRYNNSQNSIDEKTFVSNNDLFNRIQEELEKKGFLLLIKQSDKNKYTEKYPTPSKLLDRNKKYLDRFGITLSTTKELMINLEKLLQVILAFSSGGYQAYTKKSYVLKFDSPQYKDCLEFIHNSTTDQIISLYLLYLKSEIEKKSSSNKRVPIPYYLIDCFAKYECSNRDIEKIIENLSDSSEIEKLIELYKGVTQMYSVRYEREKETDYNKMIKQTIDYELIEQCRACVFEMV